MQLDIEYKENVTVIDLCKLISQGMHPKKEVIEFVSAAERGTVIELHVPHEARPLVSSLEAIGLPAILNRIGPEHFRIMCVKL